jgi:peptide/nickel transport system ATP-binding protein
MTDTLHANGAVPATASSESVLEVVHLRKEFPLRGGLLGPKRVVHAVEDVTLGLAPGRVTALVGESGSGKTTVARLLARMYPTTGGEILVRGKPLAQSDFASLQAYRRQVQLIFQDPFSSLNPVHTVKYHLSRPLRLHHHIHNEDELRRQVLSLLERVNLTPAEQFIEKFPHELSGGQRQRVAIARALAANPTVLLADEPVSMLDVSIRLGVLNLLMRLKEEQRLALLYITHDIASARYFADETYVMYAGQMVEGGPSEEVIQRPKHPYTQLLISAAPDPDRMYSQSGNGANGASLTSPETAARGEPPSLINPPSGCRFHPRCPHVMPVCRERFPVRTDLGGGHWTHCFLYDQGSAPAAVSSPALNASKEHS